MSPTKRTSTTTPTSRCTWIDGSGLTHYALVQPRTTFRSDLCDLLVACSGFKKGRNIKFVGPVDAVVNCITCLGSKWETETKEMEEDGRLMEIEELKSDYILTEHLLTAGALMPPSDE